MRLMDHMQEPRRAGEPAWSASSTAATSTRSTPRESGGCLGEEAKESFEQLRRFLEILEEAGYIRRKGRGWELTPRAIRKIGEKALAEVYAQHPGGAARAGT